VRGMKNLARQLAARSGYLVRRRHPSELSSASIHRVARGSVVGRFLVANSADSIQGCHFEGAFYEGKMLDLILDNFSSGTFVDVGANVGNHSIFVALARPEARLVSFEPHPEAFTILSANVGLNRLFDRVELNRVALSDAAGSARIGSPHHNLGGSTLENKVRGKSELQSFESCDTARGDDVLSGPVDFLKIDVEGHEVKCLKGMARLLERYRPTILIEVDASTANEVADLLGALGYSETARDGSDVAQTILYSCATRGAQAATPADQPGFRMPSNRRLSAPASLVSWRQADPQRGDVPVR
jgi:FkbM family methyltransferase